MTLDGETRVALFTLLGVLLGTVLAAAIQLIAEWLRGVNARRLETMNERRVAEISALHAAHDMRRALRLVLARARPNPSEEEDLAQAAAFSELVQMADQLEHHALTVAALGSKDVSARLHDIAAFLHDYLMGLGPRQWAVESRAVSNGMDGKFEGLVRAVRHDIRADELESDAPDDRSETIWETITWGDLLPDLDREGKTMGKFEGHALDGRRATLKDRREKLSPKRFGSGFPKRQSARRASRQRAHDS